ncbi:MAG: translation initiation factor IF-3 [Candidatus Cloacimonadota bacterium]|nr:MAG: translation initiation factor IF-3 [Candidatus Cloacimonadota bacterium]PIE78137.1 MAG: translation initiation factor IF-3 [Candidatus Delongbacteria bacterium]
MNEDIKYPEVRLIDSDGTQLGVVTSDEANRLAIEKKLDLIEIAEKAKPPVCKIMDYGKFKYEQAKKEKDNKKKQHTVSIKTIRIMSVNIDENDINIKSKNARKFLEEGNKVKVFLQFRGREIIHRDMGMDVMKKFFSTLEDIAKMDSEIKAEGFRRIMMVLAKK